VKLKSSNPERDGTDIKELVVPDLWHTAMYLNQQASKERKKNIREAEEAADELGIEEPGANDGQSLHVTALELSSTRVLECWHLAHDMLNTLRELGSNLVWNSYVEEGISISLHNAIVGLEAELRKANKQIQERNTIIKELGG